MRTTRHLLLAAATALVAIACASRTYYATEARAPAAQEARVPELSRLNVVNGRPYGDMYFRHYGTNPTIDTEEEPLSTFSVDVDTASYALARSYLQRGHLPDEAAVRVEEFVNAFEYGDAPPSGGGAFAVHTDGFPSPNRKGYQLVRIALKGREVTSANRRPAHLVFVIDVSGSMAMENRLGLVKRSLELLVEQLDARDTVALVVYGSTAHVVLEPTPATDRTRILEGIEALVPEGSTNVQSGLALGYGLAARQAGPGVVSRVVLCSDGVANNGITDADRIFATVREHTRKGVTLSAVGFGMGNYNDVLMERLAQVGDGNYSYVDSLAEARRIFVEELTGTLQVIAKDVKLQVDFDRESVSRYRLLGFESRLLDARDFSDDRVDAGDIGAGHTVVALYEVKLKGTPSRLGTVRVRHKEPDGATSRLVEAPLSIDAIAREYARAPAATRLAHVASAFAEKLRGSYWARNVAWSEVQRWWTQLPPEVRAQPRVAELGELVQVAKRLDARKDRFEKVAPVARMDFDDVPVLE